MPQPHSPPFGSWNSHSSPLPPLLPPPESISLLTLPLPACVLHLSHVSASQRLSWPLELGYSHVLTEQSYCLQPHSYPHCNCTCIYISFSLVTIFSTKQLPLCVHRPCFCFCCVVTHHYFAILKCRTWCLGCNSRFLTSILIQNQWQEKHFVLLRKLSLLPSEPPEAGLARLTIWVVETSQGQASLVIELVSKDVWVTQAFVRLNRAYRDGLVGHKIIWKM